MDPVTWPVENGLKARQLAQAERMTGEGEVGNSNTVLIWMTLDHI